MSERKRSGQDCGRDGGREVEREGGWTGEVWWDGVGGRDTLLDPAFF